MSVVARLKPARQIQGRKERHTPQTGAEYLNSLRDDRTIYIYGERVKDVTTHPAFRNTARMVARLYDALHDPEARRQDHGADRHRQRRQDPRLLQGAEIARRSAGRAQRHRRMGADHLRLARPLARLQGGVPGDARRQRRVLRSLQRQRAALVQIQPGARALRQSRHHPSAGRPRPAAERSRRHLLSRREGNRRRHRRFGRQGGGHRLGAHQLHLRRASRPHPGAGQEIRRRCSWCRPTIRA